VSESFSRAKAAINYCPNPNATSRS